jgi:hypothetical protein
MKLLTESIASARHRFVNQKKVISNDQFEAILKILLPFDPSPNQKYIEQLFNYYLQATPKDRKDSKWLEELSDTIRIFNYVSRNPEMPKDEKDITKLKTFEQLLSVVNKYRS